MDGYTAYSVAKQALGKSAGLPCLPYCLSCILHKKKERALSFKSTFAGATGYNSYCRSSEGMTGGLEATSLLQRSPQKSRRSKR